MTDAIDLTTGQRKTLITLLRRFLPGVTVWAYGSRVKWTARPNSDLDLVAFTTPAQRPQVVELKEALAESNLPFPVDLHAWDDVPERFREIIRKEYVVVQESNQSGSGSDGLGMVEETLPNDWTWTTLGAVADFVNGDRSSNYPAQSDRVGAGVPFINTGHIEPNGRLTSVAMDHITRDSFERLRSGKVKAGDIVYCLRGSTIGKTARNHFTEGAIASSLVIVRAKANACQEYLYFYLTSPLGQQLVKQHDNGSAQPNLSVRSLCNYPLPLPPLPEQRAIAHILGPLDDKIELNRRMNETLEAMARALFKSWFVDFDPVRAKAAGRDTGLPKHIADLFPDSFEDSEMGEIPRGWKVGCVDDEFNLTMGQSPPGETYNEAGDGLPFYQGRTDFNFRFPTRRVYCTAPTRLAKKGDTLVSVRAPVGDINMAAEDCAIGRGVAAARHKTGSRSYSYQFMRSQEEVFARFEAEGTVFGSIGKQDFHAISCVVPSRELVLEFERQLTSVDSRIEVTEQENLSLSAMRNTLLPQLISGELRIRNAAHFPQGMEDGRN